ncbi:site-specific DNA recombinase [Bacillus sp. FW1]|nr:site-specific DNA recombinase [Bacillus sp. FW1]
MIAIYVRVSTEEQAIKGSSIDSQIEACIKKAGTKDVLKYADEGFSGELISDNKNDVHNSFSISFNRNFSKIEKAGT